MFNAYMYLCVPMQKGRRSVGGGRGRPWILADRAGGFTLLELLVVVTIAGILVGMASPRLDVASFKIRTAVQRIGSTLLMAQRQAIRRQHDVVVAFDVAGNMLRVHVDADNDGVMDGGEDVRWTELGEHVGFGLAGAPARAMGGTAVTYTRAQGGLPAVTFHRNGSVSEEGGFYLTSRRALRTGIHTDDTHAVEIARATGRVSWFRFDAEAWRRGF